MSRGPGDLDAAGAVAAVNAGRVAPTDLLTDARARISRWEPWLGALAGGVSPAAGGGGGPLRGAIIGVKDLLAVAGQPRECGAPDLVDCTPQREHATAVARLVAAGARIVGRLSTHPLAYGIITPQTRNPRVPERIAGGSSGGAGAALAAGLLHGALGTDSGGSIRVPAACCGVVGLKPTRGLVPLTGVQPLAYSLDTVGPLATTVADVALLLEAIAGFDSADPYSEPARTAPRPRAPLRIGVPHQVRDTWIDPLVRTIWQSTLDLLADTGATVTGVDLPALDEAPRANDRILAAEATAVHLRLLEQTPDLLAPDLRAVLERGRELAGHVVAAASRHGAVLRTELRDVFSEVDVLITPTLPCRVPLAGVDEVEVEGETEPVTRAVTRLVNPWNLAGTPAGSVPAGAEPDGAPVGVQVVGPWFAEETVLTAMAAVESVTGGPWSTVKHRPTS